MTTEQQDYTPVPLEAAVETMTPRKRASIGLPKCDNPAEKRFPLTPEAVAALTHAGFCVKMEEGAAAHIHYSDAAYVRAGARIVARRDALHTDIVIHLAPLGIADIRQLHRGAMLLSLANFNRPQGGEVVRELVSRRVVNIAIDLVRDEHGNRPFADILSEIDGRSAMTLAAAMLADPLDGKGILLGGIAGVVPCEVTVVGSCLAACAAARSAMGLGAVVRMFDDDVYRLRSALRQLGNGVIGSSLHPHVLENALRAADVVVVTHGCTSLPVDGDVDAVLKRKVILFDLSECPGAAFPKAHIVDLGNIGGVMHGDTAGRVCYVNPGNTVPRTAAMALSDTFITLLGRIAGCGDSGALLPMTPGLQEATLTFMGKAVNARVAELAGLRYTDIRLLLSLS